MLAVQTITVCPLLTALKLLKTSKLPVISTSVGNSLRISQISSAVVVEWILLVSECEETQIPLWYEFDVSYQSLFTRRHLNSFATLLLKSEIPFNIGSQPSVSPSSDLNSGCWSTRLQYYQHADSLITCRSGLKSWCQV